MYDNELNFGQSIKLVLAIMFFVIVVTFVTLGVLLVTDSFKHRGNDNYTINSTCADGRPESFVSSDGSKLLYFDCGDKGVVRRVIK